MADDPTTSKSSFDEWPSKAADLVDLVVDTFRDRVIRPIILVGRSIVFGLLIAAVVIVISVVVAVAILRLLDVYAFAHHVWASYTVLGIVFSAAGLWAWVKRSPPAGSDF